MTELIIILLGILVFARIGGELFERIAQPSVLGELLFGLILGLVITYSPVVPGQLATLSENEVFLTLGDLGILFMLLFAGMQIDPQEFAQASKAGILVALLGVLFPLTFGFILGQIILPDSEYLFAQSLFLGVALCITDVPISVRVLMDLGKLDTRVGRTLVSAAAIDDVIGLILLAILTGATGQTISSAWTDIALLLVKVSGFFVFALILGRFVMPWLAARFHRMKSTEVELTVALVFALAASIAAELSGLHFAVGAFLAGIFVKEVTFGSPAFASLKRIASGIALGFLAPFFFVSLGLSVDFSALGALPFFVIGVILVGIAGKLIGGGLGAKFSHFSVRESLALGWGMNGRGSVALVVAKIALGYGLFEHPVPIPEIVKTLYPSVLVTAFAASLLVPIGLRLLWGRSPRTPEDSDTGD